MNWNYSIWFLFHIEDIKDFGITVAPTFDFAVIYFYCIYTQEPATSHPKYPFIFNFISNWTTIRDAGGGSGWPSVVFRILIYDFHSSMAWRLRDVKWYRTVSEGLRGHGINSGQIGWSKSALIYMISYIFIYSCVKIGNVKIIYLFSSF